MSKAIFFDLDGTLWDASESTAQAWTEVFVRWALPGKVTKEDIRGVAGKPYLECLRLIRPAALEHPERERLLADLSAAERAWMERIGGEPYPGALDAVRTVAARYPVFLVSNCNDWYLEAFLNHSGLRSVFSDSICHGTNGRPKAENIRLMLDKHDLRGGFYVGDTVGDMEASLAAGVRYVHAAFGFGGPAIANSHFVLSDYDDLPAFLATLD
jgi:phosphoglycolate phosphatase